MKPLFTCSKAGWIRVTARTWRIRLSVKREISFISRPTCRTNPSILAPPNRQWLWSHAMMPTSKNMLSPITDKIANEIGSDDQHVEPPKQNRSLRHLYIEFGPALIGWDLW